jgi:hypothetical protein
LCHVAKNRQLEAADFWWFRGPRTLVVFEAVLNSIEKDEKIAKLNRVQVMSATEENRTKNRFYFFKKKTSPTQTSRV